MIERFVLQYGAPGLMGGFVVFALVAFLVTTLPLLVPWWLAQRAARRGDFVGAERHLRRAWRIARCLDLGLDGNATGETAFRLTGALTAQRRFPEALAFARRSIACFRKQKNRRSLALATIHFAHVEEVSGSREHAESHFDEGLALWRASGAKPHHMVGVALVAQAHRALRARQLDEALRLIDESLAMSARSLGQGMHLVHGLVVRATILRALGREEEAEASLRRALGLQERAWGREHAANAPLLRFLVAVLLERGKTSESDQLMARAVAIETRGRS